ncbi:MAG: tetratricopeptide repeat protein [Deltaproteobacteria bacterium]|nr:tetratricopeptide repeat protein [Deltaproteobacteria bacterium]
MASGKDDTGATMEVLGETAPADSGPPLPKVETEGIAVGTQIGRLVVLGPLGEGGTALVYVAYDRELDRKVALKFMRPSLVKSERATAARTRLMREAQALARLNHPNVVAIHDVGTYGDVVFIAESFVDGWTLTDWLTGQPRSVRDILDVFTQAGRALEAAHAAGLVHRDFKPDNVLVGRDGRAQVTDFGLARATDDTAAEEPVQTVGATLVDSSGVLASPLTRTGMIMGTPAYMAPEQHLSQRADARTDQFNYCVSLYEILYGERPFTGTTVGELAREVTQGRVRPAPKDTKVPAWLRKVILRGLRPDPADRYPSMTALLEALGRDPAVTRRRASTVVGLVVLLAAVAFGVSAYHQRASRVCGGAERKLAGVWDDSRRDAVRRTFVATNKPYAEAAWRGVVAALDAYTRTWVGMHEDACSATRVRGEQSEALLDLRVRCLTQRLSEVKALVDVLEGADAEVVERAAKAAGALSGLAVCADAEALKGVLPPPKDAATRTRVQEVRARVARAKALEDAGKYDEALKVATAAAAEAKELGYRPLEAEALYQAGVAKADKGDYKGAELTLHEALFAAIEGRHRQVEASTAVVLTHYVGYTQRRIEQGHFWANYGKAALATLGTNEALEARWHNAIAGVYYAEAKYDKQLVHNQRALALRQRAFGNQHMAVASSLNNLGVTHSGLGNPRQAAEYFDRGREVFEIASGPDHPDVALALMNLAGVHGTLGEFAKQRAEAERSVAIFEKAAGLEHPHTAMAVANLAAAFHNQESHEEALKLYRRALAVYEKTEGPKHPDTAGAMEGVGRELRCIGGQPREALAQGRRAAEMMEAALGKDHPELASPLSFLGLAQLDAGAPAEALATFERTWPLRVKARAQPDDMAETRFGLAQALWQLGRDRPRALKLAEEARHELRKVAHRKKELLKVSVWLKERGGDGGAGERHGH